MRSKPETLEEHAAKCERMAADTVRRDLRLMYGNLARQWRRMAGQLRLMQQIDEALAESRCRSGARRSQKLS